MLGKGTDMPETTAETRVPMEIEYRPAWLSWVGSTTMCLNALGIECDMVDVAGYSGYAFAIAISPGLCPSGPTDPDWAALAAGPLSLGRSAMSFVCWDCHTDGSRCGRTREHCREVFQMVAREIESGRPCVLWGAGTAEFGVVRGIDGADYLLVKGGPIPERVGWDDLDAPGGPYALAFPTPVQVHEQRDLEGLIRAVNVMQTGREDPGARRGPDAYAAWAEHLRAGRAAVLGNSYNAQCWAEARRCAHAFLDRLVNKTEARYPILIEARDAFHTVADRLRQVAELFPFTSAEGVVEDGAVIDEAADLLAAAGAAEQQALDALRTMLARVRAAQESQR
jgi:hypothetical protein